MRSLRTASWVLLLAVATGCSGDIIKRGGNGGSGGGDGGAPAGSLGALAPAHVRRLSVTELRNSLRDLFELDPAGFPSDAFPTEVSQGVLENDAQSLSATDAFTEPLQQAAEWAAAAAVAKKNLISCDSVNG